MELTFNPPINNEDLEILKTVLIEKTKNKSLTRKLFPIRKIGKHFGVYHHYTDDGREDYVVHVIHKEYTFTGKFSSIDFEEKTITPFLEAETKLTFTGEHKGWEAEGIRGLTTSDHRCLLVSLSGWTKSVIRDITKARRVLLETHDKGKIILVVNLETNEKLEQPYWETKDEEPLTYINFLKKQNLIDEYIVNEYLYDAFGNQNIALLLMQDEDETSFWVAESMEPEITLWTHPVGDKLEYCVTLRESLVPIIGKPQHIVEITNL